MKNRIVQLGAWMSVRMTFLGLVIGGLMVGEWYEREYMPVVSYFNVERSHWDGNRLSMWGEMNKVRPCKFSGEIMSFYEPAGLPMTKATTTYPGVTKSRPLGVQTFGPIWVDLPSEGPYAYVQGEPVRIFASHTCNPLWPSQSEIGEFTPPPIL